MTPPLKEKVQAPQNLFPMVLEARPCKPRGWTEQGMCHAINRWMKSLTVLEEKIRHCNTISHRHKRSNLCTMICIATICLCMVRV